MKKPRTDMADESSKQDRAIVWNIMFWAGLAAVLFSIFVARHGRDVLSFLVWLASPTPQMP